MSDNLNQLVLKSKSIVILQADNPDADSLSSSLALESILEDLGKDVTMYCGVNIPEYLKYLSGWDRVENSLPNKFDLGIIVDTSSISLFESLNKSGNLGILKSRKVIIIDHHKTDATIDFATIVHNENAVATGEIIYRLAIDNDWPLSIASSEYIVTAIMSDSLGLTSEATTANSIRIIADIVDSGVSIAKLDNVRREYQKRSKEITEYKGRLLQRISYGLDGSLALVTIPWKEIEEYSHQYNPAMLVIDEMRMVNGVKIAIVLKSYPDGKITGKIRANYGSSIADKIAEHFGGGGHSYAAGFKIKDGRSVQDIYDECIEFVGKSLR